MGKRKVTSSSISTNVKMQKKNTRGTEIEADIDSNVSPKCKPVCKGEEDLNIFADIGHKNSSRSNNWQTFLKCNHKTIDSSKLNLKNTNRPYKHNEMKLDNPVVSSIVKSLKRKIKNPNNSTRTMADSNDKLKQCKYDDNEVSKRNTQTNKHSHRPTVLTNQIAMDCEMVSVEVGVDKSMLARVSLVNAHEVCIYDKYVKPTERILDYRTWVSGIRPKDLKKGSDFKSVQKEVADIITGRILVGHALQNDLKVLFLSHPEHAIRDTSKFKQVRKGQTPSLKSLAKTYLGVTIQDGEHSSVQDARTVMQLYKRFKKKWEASLKRQFTNKKAKAYCSTSSL